VLLAIQAAVGPDPVGGRYELRVGADVFTVDGTSGVARFRRGSADEPDATVTTDAGTFRAVVFGQRPMAGAVASGDLRLDGDPAATSRLTDLLLALSPAASLAADPVSGREI
jgi:ubiquinone biosynthesis protein UbiJ